MHHAVAGRVRPVGLGVLLFALLLLVVPLRMFTGYRHPLAGVENFELCALLGREVLAALPGVTIETSPEIDGTADHPPGACVLRLKETEAAPRARELTLTVLNRRTLSQGNFRFKTEKYFETFIEEERASGSAVEAVAGNWRAGAVIQRRGAAERLDLLAEDGGVVLWFRGSGLAKSDLLLLAAASARALRGTGSGKPNPQAIN